MIELTRGDVRLRPPTLDDVGALVAAAVADPGTMRAGGDLEERLRARVERPPALADDGLLSLVVEHEGRLVGDIQARAPKHGMPPGGCEIGISLFPEARGRQIGRDAVALFTDCLLETGVHRVQATTAADNTAMRRVLEHVGYTFEGILRDYGPTARGGREDYAMYALVAGDRSSSSA